MYQVKAKKAAEYEMEIELAMTGRTDEVVEEIAAATARAIVELCDDMGTQDSLYEMMTGDVCRQIESAVYHMTRNHKPQAEDRHEDA